MKEEKVCINNNPPTTSTVSDGVEDTRRLGTPNYAYKELEGRKNTKVEICLITSRILQARRSKPTYHKSSSVSHKSKPTYQKSNSVSHKFEASGLKVKGGCAYLL